MTHDPRSRAAREASRSSKSPHRKNLLAGCLAGVVALAAPADLLANQVYKACGAKWLRKAKSLEAAQIAWLMEKRTAEYTIDLDGDGTPDTIEMTSNPSFRDCDIKKSWGLKETTVRIEFGNGKKRLFFWINGSLAEKLVIVREIGRIRVSGVDAEGHKASKWIVYRRPARESEQTLVAEGERPAATAGLQAAPPGPQAVAQTAGLEK